MTDLTPEQELTLEIKLLEADKDNLEKHLSHKTLELHAINQSIESIHENRDLINTQLTELRDKRGQLMTDRINELQSKLDKA